jgi:hypothetical protein
MSNILIRITKLFGEAYSVSKQADKNKKLMQTEFFKAIDDALSEEVRAHKTVVVPEGQDVWEYVKRLYPGWRIFKQDGNRVEVERDPTLMRYTFVNPMDKMVYARTTVEEGPSLDEELLREEDWWLWWEISDSLRQVKDPSTWTPDQMERAGKFLVPGSIKSKLVPPRAAKPEELEGLEGLEESEEETESQGRAGDIFNPDLAQSLSQSLSREDMVLLQLLQPEVT